MSKRRSGWYGGGRQGWPLFFTGLGIFGLGLVITMVTYSMASNGGTYVVSYGPIIFGVIAMVRGLAGVVRSGGGPAQQLGIPPYPGAPAAGYGQFAGGVAPGAGYPGNATPGYGNPGSGFGNATPGYGSPGPAAGNPGTGYGSAETGYGNAGPGYGNAGPGYGDAGAGYGNPGVPGYAATSNPVASNPAAGTQTPTGSGPAPNWYADPYDVTKLRWWDGRAWTAETRPRY